MQNRPLRLFTFALVFFCNTLSAQSVAINSTGAVGNTSAMLDVSAANKGLLMPRVALTSATDAVTIASPATSLMVYNTATAGTSPNDVSAGYYYWTGSRWSPFAGKVSSLVTFSTGTIMSGPSVVSSSPVLMGFGNRTVETINFLGESTIPPEAGGFSFPAPFSGTIKNLQVSADILVCAISTINTIGLQYDFTVFVAPSAPNTGTDHLASSYITTPLTSSVRFGFPNSVITAGTFRGSTNINTGSITVNAGDRIGVRVRTLQSTDPSASDVCQLSFSATVTYSQ